ncbi:MAG: 4-hydroxyphenylacetate 3-hydroxylase N-terminal domain-containing protein, partial [Trebonia sp.]
MGIRTGQQYLDKLNTMTPEIYAGGEKITSGVADHPLFRNNARSYARLFDLQHDPAHSGDLSYASPTT